MIVIGVLVAVLTILAAGAGLVTLCLRCARTVSLPEFWGASWLLGAGVVSATLALGGIFLNGAPLMVLVFLVCSVLGMLAFRLRRKGPALLSGLEGARGWEKWTVLLAFAPIIYILAVTFRDSIAWDGLIIWESKARHAFLNGGSLPVAYFANPNRPWVHLVYPLYLPYTELWAYLCIGDHHQAAAKALLPLFQVAAILILWGGARRLGASVWAASVTVSLMLFVPTFAGFDWGLLQGYSDLPLAALYLLAVVALWSWRGEERGDLWLLGAVSAGLLSWVKQEGILLLVAISLQVFLVAGWRQWRWAAGFMAPAILVTGVWKGTVRFMAIPDEKSFLPVTVENLIAGLPRLQTILHLMGSELIRMILWSFFWILALAALLGLALQRRREAGLLVLAVLVPLCLTIVPYLLSLLQPFQMHVATSFNRLALQVSLVALLGIALAMEWRGTPPEAETSEGSGKAVN